MIQYEQTKCCMCVYRFSRIAIDIDVAWRLIVEQLLVNAPLFPFSVRLAAIMEL